MGLTRKRMGGGCKRGRRASNKHIFCKENGGKRYGMAVFPLFRTHYLQLRKL